MSSTLRRTAAALAALTCALSLGACGLTPSDPPASVYASRQAEGHQTLRLVRHRNLYYVRAFVDGKAIGYLLVDTGSNITAIDRDLARELDLPVVGRSVVMGVGGREQVTLHRLARLRIEHLPLASQTVAAVDISPVARGARIKVAGILGYNTLRRWPFQLDHGRRLLTLFDRAQFEPGPDADEWDLTEIGRLPAVRGNLGEGRELWLVLDTGDNGWVSLPSAAARRWPELFRRNANREGQGFGVGGAITALHTSLPSLGIFALDLRRIPATVEWTDRVHEHRGEVVGRIGNGLMQSLRITIDANAGRLWTTWQPEQR